jgi:hypothetical protein
VVKSTFENFLEVPVHLAIEPWCAAEIVQPGEQVVFDLQGDNAKVDFAATSTGAVISVWADRIEMAVWEADRRALRRAMTWELPAEFKGRSSMFDLADTT